MNRSEVGLVLSLLSLACAGTAQETASPVQQVDYCDLAKAPQSFAGKRIRVRAIYNYGFEMQRLDPPQCCEGKPVKVWIELAGPDDLDRRSRRLVSRFPKGMGLALGVFVGVFETKGFYGHFGAYRYRLLVDRVEAVERTAHPPQAFPPSWAPTCEPKTE
jgi:hypothetical protein